MISIIVYFAVHFIGDTYKAVGAIWDLHA